MEVSPLFPSVGIEKVGRYEQNELPARSAAQQTLPSPVPRNTEAMYKHRDIGDVARGLMVPDTPDQTLLLRTFFTPALRGAIGKAAAQVDSLPDAPASDRETVAFLRKLDAAQKVLIGNIQQLTRS